MREHGQKYIDVLKEVETKWSEHTLLPKAENWQVGCNVSGDGARAVLLFGKRRDVFGDFGRTLSGRHTSGLC
jgi:hypothetical protein